MKIEIPNDEMSIIRRYMMETPIDIEGLIRRLGIKFERRALLPGQSGYFAKENGYFVIAVNRDESVQRQRFTAAHELGHFVLHRNLMREGRHMDRLFAGVEGNPSEPFRMEHEYQANRFAAELLMPTDQTIRAWHESNEVHEVAVTFAVSPAAATVRLKSLGLLPDE